MKNDPKRTMKVDWIVTLNLGDGIRLLKCKVLSYNKRTRLYTVRMSSAKGAPTAICKQITRQDIEFN